MADEGTLKGALQEAGATALGQDHRDDPVLPGSGGPAGNARLTAWTGMVLLVLFIAELVTLLDVRGLISWHLALGVLLIPPALLKTGTTGWRIVRYYAGNPPYRSAGPPPLLLRVLGPLVVITTLAVLGSGVILVLVGESASRQHAVTLAGQRVDLITLHQAAFALWCVVTGLHLLGRMVPAWQLTRTTRTHVPGGPWRVAALLVAALLGGLCVVWVLLGSGGWHDPAQHRPPHQAVRVHGAVEVGARFLWTSHDRVNVASRVMRR
ncbi:hypothetical protein ACPPVT_15130 [Angustibacter sp. McL0619]|uniref:hypothetical protein n=1 Tax=Angustibacter sp. McL0619 TaxID=3415676 RepID=UPI003CF9A70F